MDFDRILEIVKNCSCCINEEDRFITAPPHCLVVLKNILLGLDSDVEFNVAFLSDKRTVYLFVDKRISNTLFRFGVEIWEHKIDLCVCKMRINDMVLVDSFEYNGSWEVLETINDY